MEEHISFGHNLLVKVFNGEDIIVNRQDLSEFSFLEFVQGSFYIDNDDLDKFLFDFRNLIEKYKYDT